MNTTVVFLKNVANLTVITLCVIFLASCKKNDNNDNKFVNATVLGIGGDCHRLLIYFDEEVAGLVESPVPNVYYAYNIPEEFQIEGKKIEVQLGQFPEGFGFPVCTTMGPAYSSVYVTKVR